MTAYDPANIFARILRGEIPSKKVYEDDYAFAFHDIAPSAPSHILVIPKGAYRHFTDFVTKASPQEMHGFFAAVAAVAAQEKLNDYRIISNNGETAGQSVPHFHVHVLGGAPMGALLPQ